MRILFLAGGSPATIFGLTPLATAARNAGHETFMASTEEMMEVVAGAAVPPVSVTSSNIREFMSTDRQGNQLEWPTDPVEHIAFIGRGFGRMAAASLDSLIALADDWKPDVVVGGTLCFAAPLMAAYAGIPFVRHTWDTGEPPEVDPAAAEILVPELERLGLERVPEADLWIDVCPPSVRAPDAPVAQSMRYIPCTRHRKVEPWMYTKGGTKRICVTAGSRVSHQQYFDYLRELAHKVAALDVELVIASPEEVASDLTAGLDNVRAGWLPLDVVTRSCDLVVHHAGGGTALTAMNSGVPQLLVPNMPKLYEPSRRLAEYGAAQLLMPGEDTPDAITECCRELLEDPSYGKRSRELSAEITSLPAPPAALRAVEELAAG